MQIEMNEIESSSQDSWIQKDELDNNTSKQQKKYNLFQKIVIQYDDQIIKKNIQLQCQKPILNSDLFHYQDQQIVQEQTQIVQEQTQTEQQKYQLNQKKINKIKQSKQKNSIQQQQEQKKQTPNLKEQALFDVVQDDENQKWLKKKLKYQHRTNYKENSQRPLTCPQCFTQVCYAYEILNQAKKTNQVLSDNQFLISQKSYKSRYAQNIKIHQHKIVRNKFISEVMEDQINPKNICFNKTFYLKQKDLQIAQESLKFRYQDISVKILISCQQCDLQLGFWDVNEQIYTLFNVI